MKAGEFSCMARGPLLRGNNHFLSKSSWFVYDSVALFRFGIKNILTISTLITSIAKGIKHYHLFNNL